MKIKQDRIPVLLKQLYEIVSELEALFPGRKFTPDGHLVGSIGEVIATHEYDLTLLETSTATHDAQKGIRQIQIKATQGKSGAMYGEPERLLVLKLLKNGTTEEIYNGPGAIPWNNAGKVQKNGQRQISLSKLRKLMMSISSDQRIERKTKRNLTNPSKTIPRKGLSSFFPNRGCSSSRAHWIPYSKSDIFKGDKK